MSASLHDLDFYSWTHRQAQRLRAGRFHEVDAGPLIEDPDIMGVRERRESTNRVAVGPAYRRMGWRPIMEIQRIGIND